MERILVAYDGGEPARRALDITIDLAKKYEAAVTVISVVPDYPGRMPVDLADDAPVHARELAEAKQILLDHGIEADFIEPSGDPAKTIERIAQLGHFDAVIVGSRGLDPVSRFFQGSVSEHVAANTKATVIVAR